MSEDIFHPPEGGTSPRQLLQAERQSIGARVLEVSLLDDSPFGLGNRDETFCVCVRERERERKISSALKWLTIALSPGESSNKKPKKPEYKPELSRVRTPTKLCFGRFVPALLLPVCPYIAQQQPVASVFISNRSLCVRVSFVLCMAECSFGAQHVSTCSEKQSDH